MKYQEVFHFPLSGMNDCCIGFQYYPITKKDVDKIRGWLNLSEDCIAWEDNGDNSEEHF